MMHRFGFFRYIPFLLTVWVTAIGMVHAQGALTIQATAPRAGFLFSDTERVEIRAKVSGAQAPVLLEYVLTEFNGPWTTSGKVTIKQLSDGIGETPLPISLPGRGLYKLALHAQANGATANAETWIGVVFSPEKPTLSSHWSMFAIPWDWKTGLADPYTAMAENYRQLGVSWVRFNFWAHSYGKVTVSDNDTTVHADLQRSKAFIEAIHKNGMFIMGEIAQVPRELSSRPAETSTTGDAGPLWCRVKPRNYALWDQLMAQMATEFREEIQYWEILNEPDIPNGYWSGTPEEFAEFISHTSQALKRGNPNAKIVVSGFTTNGHAFAERLLQMGVGKYIDVFSVHYTDNNPAATEKWHALMKKYQLNVPLWNTEEKAEIPLNNMANGIDHSFKFLHVGFSPVYDSLRPILRKDLTVTPAGIAYAVGAHCLGTATFVNGSDAVSGWQASFFQRGNERIAVLRARSVTAGTPQITFAVTPLPKTRPTITDSLGHSQELKVTKGQVVLTMSPLHENVWFINGCSHIDISKVVMHETDGVPFVVEAETGKFSKGWSIADHAGFSGSKFLNLWTKDEPDADGYWAEVTFDIPKSGKYEVIFSGNSLARLGEQRSISPFTWQLDHGENHAVNSALPVHDYFINLAESPATLGQVDLTAGKHTFTLRLTDRRKIPDANYALWFDAIFFRILPTGK
ncbi:MAG TPA: hypothetical protein VHV83_07190 [Armatimonadota bacterium]|nr:hypothetical protein [Armatimonadota bacterium]